MTAKAATVQQPTKITAADITRLRKMAATAIDTASTLVTAAALWGDDWPATAAESIRARLRIVTDGITPETDERYAIDRAFHTTVTNLQCQAATALTRTAPDSPIQEALAVAHAAAACESADAVVHYASQAVRDAAGHDIGEWSRARLVTSAERSAERLDEHAAECRKALGAVKRAADKAAAAWAASR